MTPAAIDAVVATANAQHGSVFIVDNDDDIEDAINTRRADDDVGCFISPIPPEEMWSLHDLVVNVAVVSAPRTARELLRVLVGLDHLVAPGGKILITPEASEGGETRAEATEIFCGAYRHWERRLIGGFVVELRKTSIVRGARVIEWDQRSIEDERKPRRCCLPVPGASHIDGCPEALAPRSTKLVVPTKRVISLAVFGDSRAADPFWQKMPEYVACSVLAYAALFPGYEIRVHHDDWLYATNAGDVLHALARRGMVRLVRVARDGAAIGKCRAMLWRLLPAWDPEVKYLFCRDVDALPTWRERSAVEEFIAAAERGEMSAHTIHDSVSHAGLMGGLCGFAAEILRSYSDSLDDFIDASNARDWHQHGADQDFLNECLAPLLDVFEHSLVVMRGEDGTTRIRARSTWGEEGKPSRAFATEPLYHYDEASPPNLRVPQMTRIGSEMLVNHLGQAGGYDVDKVRLHYKNGPAAMVVRDVEAARLPADVPRAVLGCDENPDYSFFLPLCAATWRLRGYRALAVLVGDAEDWLAHPRSRLALERTRELGAEVYFTPKIQGKRTSTVAQCARIFAALLPGISPDTVLTTADVDMLAVGPWVCTRGEPGDLTVLYANAYAQDYPHWPMNYVTASARTWREVVSPVSIFVPADAAHADTLDFDRRLTTCINDAPRDVQGAWNWDERWLGEAITRWRKAHPGRAQMVDRDFSHGQWRVDRSHWAEHLAKLGGSLDGVADVHLPRPGFTNEHWPGIRRILAMTLPSDMLAWADDYRARWTEATP